MTPGRDDEAEFTRSGLIRKEGMRLSEEKHPELEGVFGTARKAFPGLHAFDKAHAVMLTEEGIIPLDVGQAILAGLREMDDDPIEARAQLGGHLHTGEAYLKQNDSETVAGWIHTGRSSADLGSVSTRWRVRDDLLDVMGLHLGVREALLEKAEAHTRTVMPGYSHLQPAQPITFGHYLLCFENAMRRDFERLSSAYEHANISPAGAGVMTGSSFDIDRERTAELLGFEEVATNTMDAVQNTDWIFETYSTYMTLYSTVAKFNEDLTLFGTKEYGFIDIADRFCGTSSIMPHKKNYNFNLFAAGATGTIYGAGFGTFIQGKTSHGRFDSIRAGREKLDECFEVLEKVLTMLPEVVETLAVNESRMRESAARNWTQGTDIADSIVRHEGVPFRTAHQITAVLVRLASERELSPAEVDVELLEKAAEEAVGERLGFDAAVLEEVVDPMDCVASRTLIGGPAPERVQDDVDLGRERVRADWAALEGRRRGLAEAADALDRAIDELLDA